MTFVHYQRVWPTQGYTVVSPLVFLVIPIILIINAKVIYCDVAVIKSITAQGCRIKTIY